MEKVLIFVSFILIVIITGGIFLFIKGLMREIKIVRKQKEEYECAIHESKKEYLYESNILQPWEVGYTLDFIDFLSFRLTGNNKLVDSFCLNNTINNIRNILKNPSYVCSYEREQIKEEYGELYVTQKTGIRDIFDEVELEDEEDDKAIIYGTKNNIVVRKTLIDNEEVKIDVTDVLLEPYSDLEVLFEIQNKSEEDLVFQTRDESVNEYMVDGTMSYTIVAGKIGTAVLTIKREELEKHNITMIQTIELKFVHFNKRKFDEKSLGRYYPERTTKRVRIETEYPEPTGDILKETSFPEYDCL